MSVSLPPYSQCIKTGFWKYFDKQAALLNENEPFMLIDKEASKDWPRYRGTEGYPECIFKTYKAKYELTRRGLFVTPFKAGKRLCERYPLADYFLIINAKGQKLAITANKNFRESVRVIELPSSGATYNYTWIRRIREEVAYITRERRYMPFFHDYINNAVYKEINIELGLVNHEFAKILLQEGKETAQ